MSDLFINDLGINCHLGSSVDEVKANLFDPTFQVEPMSIDLISGRKTYFFNILSELLELPPEWKDFNSRNNQLAKIVLDQIKSNVDSLKIKYGADRVGVVSATSTTGIEHFEQAMKSGSGEVRAEGFHFPYQEVGNLNEFVSSYLGLTGLSYGISTACSSGGKVFAEAQRLIESGFCDAVVVGGCDSFCELTLNGFDSLEATSEDICMPFSENRSGINIGEGASFFLISREPSDYKILGVGESSDAYHISSPEPDGQGAELALKSALQKANKKPEDINYVNLHGTATKKNDAMESKLIHRMFGSDTPVSSTKPLVGHTLGAAGAIELAFCLMSLDARKLPLQNGDQKWDSSFEKLNYVTDLAKLNGKTVMSNSFAFGGSNVSVIVEGQC